MNTKTRYNRGDKIGNRYLVHKVLTGGMGEVYLSSDLQSTSIYAVKTFQNHLTFNPKAVEHFKNEVNIWINLGIHPNIVQCHFMDILNYFPYVFSEWIFGDEISGTDLRSWLIYSSLNLQQIINIVIDICHGLSHAQKQVSGFVHADLKPENILLTQDKVAKITDFGLSRALSFTKHEPANSVDIKNDRAKTVLQNGVFGTPYYMSLEQWNNEDLDIRSDMYAVGCILYELIVGYAPFRASTLEKIKKLHQNAPIPKISNKVPESNDLNRIITGCLAKRRNERYSNVEDLLKDLENIYRTAFGDLPKRLFNAGEPNSIDLTNRGMTYRHLKMYDQAIEEHTKAIKLDPSFSNAYNNRGITYFDLKQYEEALGDLNKAIALSPSLAQAYNNRALVHRANERFNEAIADIDKAIEKEPSNPAYFHNRGAIYNFFKKGEKALENYYLALEHDSSFSAAYHNIGTIFADLGQHQKAISNFNRAIELDPFSIQSLRRRGEIHSELQKYEEASADFNHIIEISSNDASGYFYRGVFRAKFKLFKDALVDFNKVIALGDSSYEVYYNRGTVYGHLKQYDKALTDFNRAIELEPQNEGALRNKGNVLRDLKRYKDALTLFNEVLVLNPQNAGAYLNRGITYIDLQQIELALSDLNRAVELEPGYTEAYYNRGLLFANHLNDVKKANSDFNQAVLLDPTHLEALYNRGVSYMVLNQNNEALKDFLSTVRLAPDHARAYNNIGAILANSGNLHESLPYFEKAEQHGFVQASQTIAQIKKALGDSAPEPQTNLVQNAFEAFQLANSPKSMKQAVVKYSFMAGADFIATVEQAIRQQVPPEQQPAFRQRLAWLQQIAKDQQPGFLGRLFKR